ncbi:MAG: hypothetical protein AAFR41_06965 [Pseudomonadota bacterium]
MTSLSERVHLERHRVGPFRAFWLVLRGVVEHHAQILSVFWNDFNTPHRKNVLGVVWAYAMPLLPITAYIFVRVVIRDPSTAANQVHPAVFVILGVIPWLLIRACVITPFESINRYKTLVMNAKFPLIAAIVSGFGMVTMETLIRLVACVATLLVLGGVAPGGVVPAVAVLAVMTVFSLSIGIALVPVMIAIPDVRHVLDIFFRYAIFFSGVIWAVPELGGSDAMYRYNPLAVFIGSIRDLTLYNTVPYPAILVGLTIATPLMVLVATRTLYATELQIKESLSR